MIEARIDASELTGLSERIAKAPDVLREAKREALAAAAPKLQALVRREIGGTGKVQSWQELYVGSKGGYAAVRPKAKTYTGKSNRYAVGYVTNAINSGHRFPAPSGKQRYKPRIEGGRQSVPGLHFYESAEGQAAAIAEDAAGQVVDALINHLEG